MWWLFYALFCVLSVYYGVFLILLEMVAQTVAAGCPASCVVCSEAATICQGLPYILAAPDTTRALIVTDGSITSVQFSNLSILINLRLLRLSTNSIVEIQEGAFNGFTALTALMLDQNQLPSSAISSRTFSHLLALELLVLSSNAFSSVQEAWFNSMKNLQRLQLDRNFLTNLTDTSFGTTSLHQLKNLDLSNNLISYIDKYAFLGLPRLQELDLARNNLKHLSNVFFPLARLLVLDLTQNQWNCTCELQELTAFLRVYVSSSSRTLKSAKSMVCGNSKIPHVTTVLELTAVNCLPLTPNVTVIVDDGSQSRHLRDLILVAVFCFAGAVGLTCLMIAIFNWKSVQDKTAHHASGSCCCENLHDSHNTLRPTSYLNKAFHGCQITQESETKLMSVEEPRNDTEVMRHTSDRSTFQSERKSKVFDLALGDLPQDTEPRLKQGCFVCLNCGLLQAYPCEPFGDGLGTEDVERFSRRFQEIIAQSQDYESLLKWDDVVESKVLRGLLKLKHGFNEEQLKRQGSKFLEDLQLTQEQAMQRSLDRQLSECADPSGHLGDTQGLSSPTDNTLICKYMDCEQIQENENHMKNGKCDEAGGKSFLTVNNRHLSHRSTKPHSFKSVRFYIPDKAAKANIKQLFTKKKKRERTPFENKRDKNQWQEEELSEKPKAIENSKATSRKVRIKAKRHNFLHVKINLHPFRKTRVHPGDSDGRENVNKQIKGEGKAQYQPNRTAPTSLNSKRTKSSKKQKPNLLLGSGDSITAPESSLSTTESAVPTQPSPLIGNNCPVLDNETLTSRLVTDTRGNELARPVDTNPMKLATILMVLNIKKNNESGNTPEVDNTDLQRDNSGQDVSEGLQKSPDLEGVKHEPENTASDPSCQSVPVLPSDITQGEENNSNNNHCSSSHGRGAPATRLGLSDNPKVIIVGEDASEPMDVQQYLNARSKNVQTLQTEEISGSNERPPISREGSQKKKICLVLPEQSNGRAQSISNRKIK